MFHAKCKAKITTLEREVAQLATARDSQEAHIAGLERKLELADARLAETETHMKQARADLVQFGEACRAIAGSECRSNRQVLDALARAPGHLVDDAALSTISIFLGMRSHQRKHLMIFNMITINLKPQLVGAFGHDLLPFDIVVAGNQTELKARYRGDFADTCNRILGIVATPYLPLNPVIRVDGGPDGTLSVVYNVLY